MVKGQEQLQEEFLLGLRSGYDTITEEMSVLQHRIKDQETKALHLAMK